MKAKTRKAVDATDDERILNLFEARNEQALRETTGRYGTLCKSVARNILGTEEDAEECLNDALLGAWNAIPPAEPDDLFAYLCTVVRRLAYQKREKQRAKKRGGGLPELSLNDLPAQRQAAKTSVEQIVDEAMLFESVNRFLETLPPEARTVFLRRYWWCLTVKEIAEAGGMSQSAVKMSLSRTRQKLRAYLEGEG